MNDIFGSDYCIPNKSTFVCIDTDFIYKCIHKQHMCSCLRWSR